LLHYSLLVSCRAKNRNCLKAGTLTKPKMNRHQAVATVFLAVLLASTAAGAINVTHIETATAAYTPWAWHNTIYYIQPDGNVTPPISSIRCNGNTYTFTDNFFGGLAILKNDTVLNGNGFSIFGSGGGTGVLVQNASNVLLKNLKVRYFENGIYLDNSNESLITGNLLDCKLTVSHNSTNNLITNNTVIDDICIELSDNNTVEENLVSSITVNWSTNVTVTNNKIQDSHIVNSQLTTSNYTEGIYFDNSKNSVITNNWVENKSVGIDIWQSTGLTLKGNTLRLNQVGFKMWGSALQRYMHDIDTSNTVDGKPIYYVVNQTNYEAPTNAAWIAAVNCKGFTVQNWVAPPNWDGILLVDTDDAKITNCQFASNFNGIRLQNVSNTEITHNTISNNQYSAFYVEATTNCSVTYNEVLGNFGLFDLWHGSTNNLFCRNDFVGYNQTGNFEAECVNYWDNGAAGNYWSGFTGVDLNHDGISDQPYLIDVQSNKTDNHPLMNPMEAQATAILPENQTAGSAISMPQEYVNYTLTEVDGVLYAEIDGVYPMHLYSATEEGMLMVYPIPPDTVNIHVWVDGNEVVWGNYSEVEPDAVHYTDIGVWQMIYCQIQPASNDFLLQIHYEHPVQTINGSYTFLYDLNIAPYLSPSNTKSTIHLNIQLPTALPPLNVYLTGYMGNWTAQSYTQTLNGASETVTYSLTSQYEQPLHGDIAFVLSNSQVPELPTVAVVLVISAASALATVLYKRKGIQNSG
jgi:parallel beta-helix repeat protein